jgi:hypothetical protein
MQHMYISLLLVAPISLFVPINRTCHKGYMQLDVPLSISIEAIIKLALVHYLSKNVEPIFFFLIKQYYFYVQ